MKESDVTELVPVSHEPNVKDLCGCVCEIFPDAWPRQVREWQEWAGKKKLEPELFLFVALVCKSYFITISPEKQLEDIRNYLYGWFARGAGMGMRPEVAELVVATLTPGISKEIEKRGHQRGASSGEYFRKKGRIPEYRGVWVAALIIENYLTGKGMRPAQAKAQAVKLMTVLLDKKDKTAVREFDRHYKDAPKDAVSALREKLVDEYEHWVRQDGAHEGDIEPPRKRSKAYVEWKSKHKSLLYFFKTHGRKRFCDLVLSSIKPELWKPLWDMKAAKK